MPATLRRPSPNPYAVDDPAVGEDRGQVISKDGPGQGGDFTPGDNSYGVDDPSVDGEGGLPKSGAVSRGSESPRERAGEQGEGPSTQATLRRPSTPTPMAGSVSDGPTGAPSGVVPFNPLPGPGNNTLAGGGLFGRSGGLQGGGLGVPLDPTSNNASPSITDLLKMLLGRS